MARCFFADRRRREKLMIDSRGTGGIEKEKERGDQHGCTL